MFSQSVPFQISYAPKSVFQRAIPFLGDVGRCADVPWGTTNPPVFGSMLTMLELAVIVMLAELDVTLLFTVIFPPTETALATAAFPDTVKLPKIELVKLI